jgi:hypothetical protein
MRPAERRRRAGRLPRRVVLASVATLFAALLGLTPVSSAPAQGAMHASVAGQARRAEAFEAASAHDRGHSRDHKEGPVAVVASIIGVIAVVVFIVGLGSLSVRRRTRNGPPTRNPTQGGPPGSGRGLFDQWFRTRD